MVESKNNQSIQSDLLLNIACYEGKDREYIDEQLDIKYDSKGKIRVFYPRFFKSFIDSQSNIYKNYFERIVNGDYKMIDIDELNFCLEKCETYAHISGKSIMYLKSTSEFVALDASKYKKISDDYYVIYDKNGNLHIKNNGVYQETKTGEKNEDFLLTLLTETKALPVVEFSMGELKKNELVDLQYEWIADFSWGMHNASPKLLSQLMVKSDSERDVVKQAVDGVGHSSKIIQMSVNDTVQILEMGDLKNLESIIKIYNDAIKQQATQNGVDVNDVNLMSLFESGIAKIVEKNHINQYRKQFFRMFKKAEKQIWFKISKLFNINCEFVNIIFYPLQFLEVAITEYKESITLNSVDYEVFKKQNTQTQNTNQITNETQNATQQVETIVETIKNSVN